MLEDDGAMPSVIFRKIIFYLEFYTQFNTYQFNVKED